MIHVICVMSAAATLSFAVESPETRDARFLTPLKQSGYEPKKDNLVVIVNKSFFPTCGIVKNFSYKWIPGAVKNEFGNAPKMMRVACSESLCSCKDQSLICTYRRDNDWIGFED